MKFFVFFLLVGSFACCYGDAGLQDIKYPVVDDIECELKENIREGLIDYTGTQKDKFRLQLDGKLGRTEHALVWKGFYNDGDKCVNQAVAIKIIHDSDSMGKELRIFEKLQAIHNPKIENCGIPQIYYSGWFLKYDAIAMTLFEGSLNDRHQIERKAGRKFTDTTILSIFLQAVKGLQYLNLHSIVHNDIKPENLFLRANKVFVGDFDQATEGIVQSNGYTKKFASRNLFLGKPRSGMDDLESLCYSMFFIADVPIRKEDENFTEGYLLSQCNDSQAIARMEEKCSHFTNPKVHDVFKYISVDQVLSGQLTPDYDQIISKLNSAINAIKKGPVRFEWLKS